MIYRVEFYQIKISKVNSGFINKSGVSAIGQHNRDQRLPLPTHKSPMKGYKSSEQTQDGVEHNFPR